MDYINEKYNENGTIDCDIEHPEFGWIPTTLSPGDPETAELFAIVVAGSVAPYVAPVKTVEQLIAEINLAVQTHLATLVKSYKFTSEINYAKYVGYPNDFRVIAEALGAYEAQVWTYCEVEIAKLENGTRSMPAVTNFLTELPAWVEPT